MSFGPSLSTSQTRDFQRIVTAMRGEVSKFVKVASQGAIDRGIKRIIDGHDDEVGALVSEAQWELYGDYKINLAAQLRAGIDVIKLR